MEYKNAFSPARLGQYLGLAKGGMLHRQQILELFEYIEELEELLDEADNDDTFGTEGWRHLIGAE